MNEGHYPPPKRRGLIIHIIVLLLLTGLSGWGFFNLSRSQVGPNFVIYLLDALLAFVPIPIFGYRLYALLRADYILDRDSFAIHWGLRLEDIPLTDIEWVRPVSDLTRPLSMPWLPMPGAILGLRRHADLGLVEFMASERKDLLLIATAKRVYAVSPTNAAHFVQTFARTIEMGSLTPAEPISVYPSFIVSQAWEQPLARFTWLIGLFLNIGLVVWVGLITPTVSQISLGFSPSGSPLDPSPSSQLLLLPVISALLFVVGWLAGLYFYRWEKQRVLAFIVWVSGALTSILFLMAVLFIISTPV